MKDFDFDALRAANNLLWEWGQHFKISNGVFLRFVYKLEQDKEKFLEKIKNQKLKKKFIKDCETMFHAKLVENDLLKQYRPMIFSVLRRFKITNAEIHQTAFDNGLTALRGAIWRYRMNSVKFITYAMNGVICSVRGTVFHEGRELKKMRDKCVSLSKKNSQTDELFDIKEIACKRFPNPMDLLENFEEESLYKLARLTEDEKFICRLRIAGEKYQNKFKEHYKKKYSRTPSRTKINDMWKRIQIKIWIGILQSRGLDVLEGLKNPVTNKIPKKYKKSFEIAMNRAMVIAG